MQKKIVISIAMAHVLVLSHVASAGNHPSPRPLRSKVSQKLQRKQIIQEEIDCVNRYMKENKPLGWKDVCYAYDTPSETTRDREKKIAKALDLMSQEDSGANQIPLEGSGPQRVEVIIMPDPEEVQWSEKEEKEYENKSRQLEKRVKKAESKRVQAEERESPPALEVKKHTSELGGEIFYYMYREPIFDLKNGGTMYGLYGSHAVRMEEGDALYSEIIDMYKLDGRFSYGLVDYSSTGSGTQEGIDDYAMEFRGVGGKDFYFGQQTLITPYVGLGFRFLNDDAGGQETSTGDIGYQRTSRYLYAPIGVEFTRQFNRGWRLGGTTEIDIFLWGKQSSYLNDVSSTYPNVHNNQERGLGIRGSLKLEKEWNNVNFLVEPFIRYWHIKNSDRNRAVGPTGTVVTGYEPDNRTTEAGAKLGVQF